MTAAVLATLGIGGSILALVARRGRRQAAAARGALLDPCVSVFDDATATYAPDGFPRLAGYSRGRHLRVALVPDTLTLKRLPQLWLVVSLPRRLDVASLVVTARPRGDDFISRAQDLRRHLDVPAWLPEDCAVRGESAEAASLLAALRQPLESAFADLRLKEISIGPQGLRLVYQACQGARGAHLLLRQARFIEPVVAQTLKRCRAMLLDIEAAAINSATRAAA